MLNIAAVVILYHPDHNLPQRINTYLRYISKLYVFDNSESATLNFFDSAIDETKIIYKHDGENKGISIRLNEAASLAIEDKADWLLTMDQDSYFSGNSVPIYFECIKMYSAKDSVAMFGVQYINEQVKNDECTPKEVNHLITSGSIINLNLFKNIGPFDEALFIDKVDHEYCLRARLFRYKIIQFHNIYLHHSLGSIVYGRSVKNFKLTPRVIHSPLRMYYILRNYLYLSSKYKGKFEDSFSELKKELFIRIKNNFFYGKHRIKLLTYLAKGYRDYKAGKMGKIH
jgi:rhamnosyltransferase